MMHLHERGKAIENQSSNHHQNHHNDDQDHQNHHNDDHDDHNEMMHLQGGGEAIDECGTNQDQCNSK